MSSTTAVEVKTETKTETKPEIKPELEVEQKKPQVPTIEIPISPQSPNILDPALKTPLSAVLPSALPKSPASARLEAIKQEEDDLKTPITPPSAYIDFLKALSPALSTPSTGRSPVFDRLYSGKTTPITQPSSAASCCCTVSHEAPPSSKTAMSAPIIPPSPFMRPPTSARTPTGLRRLRIPQSPVWSPTASDSPHSSCHSMRSPFSSADWNVEKMRRIYDSPRSATHNNKPVSVRQVVTRTVTYTRSPITPLEPAPKGKKRRVE